VAVTLLAQRQLRQTPLTRTVSGTTDTITSADDGKVIYYTGTSSAITATVDNTVGVGFTCTTVQAGTQQVTIAAGTGMTRRQRQSYTKTAGQYAMATIHSHLSGEFIIQGDLA